MPFGKLFLFILLTHQGTVNGYTPLNEEGIKRILEAHNRVRSEIALGKYKGKDGVFPKAANMMKMIWNNTLAKSAQRHADSCSSEHTPASERYFGENLFRIGGAGNNYNLNDVAELAVKEWILEYEKVSWTRKIPMFRFSDGMGHATQATWANSYVIGCGAADCGDSAPITCQYWPAGNISPGVNVYEVGEPCSKCPSNSKCDSSTGLCVSSVPPDIPASSRRYSWIISICFSIIIYNY